MTNSTLRQLSVGGTHALARLMELGDSQPVRWLPHELGAILRHQLKAPLFFDLKGIEPSAGSTTGADSDSSTLNSFADLFQHPSPPVELLTLAKQFANASDNREEGSLPPEIATVLYFSAILAARLRCGISISGLSDAAIRRGANWALGQEWLEENLRQLFQQALAVLGP